MEKTPPVEVVPEAMDAAESGGEEEEGDDDDVPQPNDTLVVQMQPLQVGFPGALDVELLPML